MADFDLAGWFRNFVSDFRALGFFGACQGDDLAEIANRLAADFLSEWGDGALQRLGRAAEQLLITWAGSGFMDTLIGHSHRLGRKVDHGRAAAKVPA